MQPPFRKRMILGPINLLLLLQLGNQVHMDNLGPTDNLPMDSLVLMGNHLMDNLVTAKVSAQEFQIKY